MHYIINNGVIAWKGDKPLANFHGDVFESKLDLDVGWVLTTVDGEDVWQAPEMTAEQTIEARKAAYKARSDDLYMEWQYDGTEESEQIWRDEVESIKSEFPL